LNKKLILKALFAFLSGTAFSLVVGLQLLDIWMIEPLKGGLLLLGMVAVSTFILFMFLTLILKRLNNAIKNSNLLFILFWIMAFVGITIFPMPKVEEPNGWKYLEIHPGNGNEIAENDTTILIEEIKDGNNTIPLTNIMPSSGWLMTEYGLKNESSSQTPIVVIPQGNDSSNYTLLFGRSPTGGVVRIRVGWIVQYINLKDPNGESEISILANGLSSDIWQSIYSFSLWIIVGSALFLILMFVIPKKNLEKVSSTLVTFYGSILFWVLFSFFIWYWISFVRMVFLNNAYIMQNGNFLPAIRPIGNDLDLILNASRSILAGGSPYAGANKYPPAALIF
jgi:hypothetical protein